METLDSHTYLVRIKISLDEKVDIFEVSGLTLVALISELGGFLSAVYGFGKVFVYLFARDEFWGSLIKGVYRTKQIVSIHQSKL